MQLQQHQDVDDVGNLPHLHHLDHMRTPSSGDILPLSYGMYVFPFSVYVTVFISVMS
jgi:hypothetical protein